MLTFSLKTKQERLLTRLEDLGSLVVAFSGGLDSSFLLAVAREALGSKVLAVTATSPIHLRREREAAQLFARDRGIEHILLPTREMNAPDFLSNSPERCYHCKKMLLEQVLQIAAQRGIPHVAHGANLDDLQDYRPGARAAEEAGILAPLVEVALGKEEIRILSRALGLPTWDRPSMACLASRIPYGEVINEHKLRTVEEAEDFLVDQGLQQFRVRHHGSVARVEADEDGMRRLMQADLRRMVLERFKELGFLYVALDMEGYVSGSMNRSLAHGKKPGTDDQTVPAGRYSGRDSGQ